MVPRAATGPGSLTLIVSFKLSPYSLNVIDLPKVSVAALFTSIVSVMTTLATIATALGSALHFYYTGTGKKRSEECGEVDCVDVKRKSI